MPPKNLFNYFDAFRKLSKFSLDSSILLHKTFISFSSGDFQNKVKEMHGIEHKADLAKHEIMDHLIKEFLPPIEREDITSLSQKIDDVTDAIEDVLLFINMFNIKRIRPEILKFTEIIQQCCKTMDMAMAEFKHFRSSKTLRDILIKINQLEEEADTLYVDMMKKLYRSSTDPIELMKWTEILHRLEKCCDACEDVADTLEEIIMKNS